MYRNIIATLVLAFFSTAQVSFAAEDEGLFKMVSSWGKNVIGKISPAPVKEEVEPAAPSQEKVRAQRELTKSEMVTGIKESLEDNEEMLNFVPGLKMEKSDKGEPSYKLEGIRLEDLDKDRLKSVYIKVRQQATRIRTERLNRQMETVRRSQQLTNISRQATPRVPPVPTPIPKTYTPPAVPRASNQPPQVAKPPLPPPAPPRR
jgi:hypothetical protein